MKKIFTIILLCGYYVFAQYTTPNTNAIWNLDSLVVYSSGVVIGSFPNYTINQKVTVSLTDKITVLPGTTVNFLGTTAGFDVNGTFISQGSSSSRNTFTSTSGDSVNNWAGITFYDSARSASYIQYTDVYFAKYGARMINSATIHIEHNNFFKCGRGIQLSGSSPYIFDNRIERCFEYGITMTLGSSPYVGYNVIINNNTQNTSPKTQITVGTQGINSPTIVHNNIIGGWNNKTGGIAISCLLGGSGSSSEIAYNTVVGNSYGISLSGLSITCYVHHNTVTDNNIISDPNSGGSGININGNSTNIPIISSNLITNNLWGITIQNGTSIIAGPLPNIGNLTNADTTDDGKNVIYNNTHGGLTYDLFNNTTLNIMAQNNDWKVYDSISIENHVIHKIDDTARGLVVFLPFIPNVPVELISFTAQKSNKDVLLNWTTATENNNKGFEIYRKDGSSWTSIGFVNGKGNSTQITTYKFIDQANKYTTYYKLKQIDFNGSFKYSSEVMVSGSEFGYTLMQNYPNPFNPSTKIEFTIAKKLYVKLYVYNLLGQSVAELVNSTLDAGSHSVSFDAKNLPAGTYFYKLEAGDFIKTNKMMLIK